MSASTFSLNASTFSLNGPLLVVLSMGSFAPQTQSFPLLSSAAEKSLPAAAATKCCGGFSRMMCSGACPWRFAPQQAIVPSVLTSIACVSLPRLYF